MELDDVYFKNLKAICRREREYIEGKLYVLKTVEDLKAVENTDSLFDVLAELRNHILFDNDEGDIAEKYNGGRLDMIDLLLSKLERDVFASRGKS